MKNIKILKFQRHDDSRGSLIALEACKEIPFDIKRVYYLFGIKGGARRGFHAHKKLSQVLICLSGSCTLFLDNGEEKKDFVLDNPSIGLFISHDVWREMYNFSNDAVLMVLASECYDESDYIRNYDDFINYLKERNV